MDKNNIKEISLISDRKSTTKHPTFNDAQAQLATLVSDRGEILSVDEEGTAVVRVDDKALLDEIFQGKHEFIDQWPVPGHTPAVADYNPHRTQDEEDIYPAPALTC